MTIDTHQGDEKVLSTRPRRWRLHPILAAGLVIMSLLVLTAIIAPMFLRDAAQTLTDDRRLPPGGEHILGTDDFGRDLFARALVATRLTLQLTFAASALSVVGGVLIGTAVWFLPARVRNLIVSANAVAVAFPGLVLALVIAAILGPGAWTAAFAVGAAGVPVFVRLTVNISAPIMRKDYVMMAGLMGVPRHQLIGRHVLPNMAEPLLVLAASNFSVTLVELSGLSFIGLGVQSPEYDFGRLLSDALTVIYAQPHQVIGPAVMIVLTGLAGMLIGDGLAASSNPRTRGERRASRTGQLRRAGGSAVTADAATPGAPATDAPTRVRNLTVRSGGGKDLVRGVSFEIRKGEIVALVGESGSGKSLTAMTLAGLVPEGVNAEADEVVAGGHDLLGRPSAAELARDIALVYQDPVSTFNPALRLDTQLTEVARLHLGMGRKEARKALLERFERLRITKPDLRARQRPHQLSGGMLQRAMISSALLSDASLIIADEPTTALDVTVQAEVLRQFVSATDELGASVLFISHDLGVVAELCDRVLVMYSGEVVEELDREQLRAGDVQHPYTRKLLDAAEYVEGL